MIIPVTGKNERIDLATFYPFLALLADLFHCGDYKSMHPALMQPVINNPSPSSPPEVLPDGSAARLVVLGPDANPLKLLLDRGSWWPSASTVAT